MGSRKMERKELDIVQTALLGGILLCRETITKKNAHWRVRDVLLKMGDKATYLCS